MIYKKIYFYFSYLISFFFPLDKESNFSINSQALQIWLEEEFPHFKQFKLFLPLTFLEISQFSPEWIISIIEVLLSDSKYLTKFLK